MPYFLASFPDFLALGLVLLLTGEKGPETEKEEKGMEGELAWGRLEVAERWRLRTEKKRIWNNKERKARQRTFFRTLGLLVI